MAEIIPWLFLLPPVIVAIVALATLMQRRTPAGRAHQSMTLGGQHLYRQEYEAAEKHFRQGLELKPEHPGLLGVLASLLVSLERYDEANPVLEKAIAAQPKDDRLKIVHGRMLYGQGKTDEALAIWESIPEESEVYMDTLMILADLHKEELRLPEAIEVLERGATVGEIQQRLALKRELRRLKKIQAQIDDGDPPEDLAEAINPPAKPARAARASRRGRRARRTASVEEE